MVVMWIILFLDMKKVKLHFWFGSTAINSIPLKWHVFFFHFKCHLKLLMCHVIVLNNVHFFMNLKSSLYFELFSLNNSSLSLCFVTKKVRWTSIEICLCILALLLQQMSDLKLVFHFDFTLLYNPIFGTNWIKHMSF